MESLSSSNRTRHSKKALAGCVSDTSSTRGMVGNQCWLSDGMGGSALLDGLLFAVIPQQVQLGNVGVEASIDVSSLCTTWTAGTGLAVPLYGGV